MHHMSTCLTCQHCDLKADTAMARLGYGHCEVDELASKFRPFDREIECKQFERLPADRERARLAWADGRR
ncbi:hypothetical protein [Cupriavidus necator]